MSFLRAAARRRRDWARPFARFTRDTSGSITVALALAAVTALALVGAGIDYSRAVNSREKLQNAVDQAMLAAMQAPAASRVSVATNMLNAALANSGVTASWSTPPTLTSSGNLTGTASGTARTILGGLTSVASVHVVATSTVRHAAASVPSSLVFTLTGGYGWYWKEVDLYIHQPGASSDTLMAAYQYQPVDLSYSGGRGKGAVTAQFLVNGTMVANAVSTPVALGANYDNVYLKMTVYSDGCGPGMAPTTPQSGSTTDYNCVASGTQALTGWTWWGQPVYTTYTKTATPVYYATNDAQTAHNLFVGTPEVDLPNNAVPSIFTLLPCGQTIQHAWEDTPWASPLPGSWSTQDVFFNVQATSCQQNASYQTNTPSLIQ